SRAPRYNSVAFIEVNGFEGRALLKNISATGFCMQSKTYASFTPGEKYIIRIFPGKSIGLNVIEAEVEARWVRSEVSKFEVGLLIIKSSNQDMEKYVEYIRTHPGPDYTERSAR
ncbi:MAG: PilZ domain-containing protein, partial [Treponema sp.]|nr:PilZ domain-containing protein [Treponema sp.]